ncbi:hypothetical protein R3P38DRAFT_2814305 [Favolaschia claudopus]|uniref:Uncharacterized protein n=1 Tax=Favolaschia claudopus TaxID=2862362 RepID=A0AAV9Z3E9_9AGAR
MKFSLATSAALFAAVTSAFGAMIVSPTLGQVLPANTAFNLTYASQRYFKESSLKITVVTAGVDGGFPAATPVQDLEPTSYDPENTSANYYAEVFPITLYNGQATGNHTIYVIESYAAYGGSSAVQMLSVPVTFV